MTKEELIKIFSVYLPYDTKLYCEWSSVKIQDLKPIEISCIDHHIKYKTKLILHSMNMLTKEIKYNGEKKILAKELFKGKWKDISEYYVRTNQLMKLSYDCVQTLVEHHFNIFNLPETEFINKATLDQ
jgi:hypothetical protein